MSLAQAHTEIATIEPAVAGWFSASVLAGAAYIAFMTFAFGLV